MRELRTIRAVPALVMVLGLVASLAGCGGGGGGGTSINDADVPFQAPLTAYAQQPHTFTLSGSVGAVRYEMDYTFTPEAGTTVFEGRTVSTALQRTVLRQGGVVVQDQTLRSYFTTSPYAMYGAVDQADGTYAVVDLVGSLPATARVGQTGPMGTETDYSDSTKTQVVGTASLSWSVEADTATTALLCQVSAFTGTASGTVTDCYRVDATGAIKGAVVKLTVGSTTLVLQ